MEQRKVIHIALDDYLRGLHGIISNELYGRIQDELKNRIPNELKDEKLRVKYDPNSERQHVYLFDLKHDIKVVKITEEIL